jgi:hypothetical protein
MVDDRRQSRSGQGQKLRVPRPTRHWPLHLDNVVKKEHQHLFKPQEAGEIWRGPMRSLTNYRRIIESTPSRCLAAWYSSCTARNCGALQKVVWSVQRITGGTLPALQDTFSTRCHRKAKKIIKDLNHPSHGMFTPLSSRRSVQVHQSWDRKLLLAGYQPVFNPGPLHFYLFL